MTSIRKYTFDEIKNNSRLFDKVKSLSSPNGRFRWNYTLGHNVDILLFYRNREIIAISQIEHWKHSYLFGVYVNPSFRRNRVAEQLLKKAKSIYKNLVVIAGDEQSKLFYDKFQKELSLTIIDP